MTNHQINAKYPVRNRAWNFDESENTWVTERSGLNGVGLDPWNRPFREQLSPFYNHQGTENGDWAGWRLTTTVEGNVVMLTIFND